MHPPPAAESLKTKPVHRRSRQGCRTCRVRRKKCPEVFNADGVCERCEAGGYVCDRDAPKPSGSTPVAPSTFSKSLPPIRPRPGPSSSAVPRSSASRASTASPWPPEQPPASAAVHQAPTFALPPAPQALYPPPPLTHSLGNLDAPFDPLTDLSYSSDLLSFFESLEPAVDPASFTSTSAEWFPELPLPTSGTTTPLHPPEGASHPMSIESLAGVAAQLAGSSGPTNASASQTECERLEEKYAEDHAAAVPIYHALNDGFFISLPPQIRTMVKARMMDVAFSNELSKSSAMAICLLYRARMSSNTDSTPEARQRLITESDQYFNKAVQQLQATDIPLEAQILACLDLELFQLEQHGAAAGYAILMLGDYFIQQQLGTRPSIDLLTLSGEATILLRCFACIDVVRCMSLGGRRTLFEFIGAPGATPTAETGSKDPSEMTSEVLSAVMGLPVGIVIAMAGTCNLAMDEGTMEKDIFERKAREIEKSIKEWRPVPITPEQAEDSIRVMDAFVTHEMWRHAALIHAYQSLFHYGPLHASVKRALSQLLALAARTSPSLEQIGQPTDNDPIPLSCATSERAAQLFLASTVALDPRDRAICREGLRRCRPAKLAADNLECVERIWEVTDSGGHTVDWRAVLGAEGRYVGFL